MNRGRILFQYWAMSPPKIGAIAAGRDPTRFNVAVAVALVSLFVVSPMNALSAGCDKLSMKLVNIKEGSNHSQSLQRYAVSGSKSPNKLSETIKGFLPILSVRFPAYTLKTILKPSEIDDIKPKRSNGIPRFPQKTTNNPPSTALLKLLKTAARQ